MTTHHPQQLAAMRWPWQSEDYGFAIILTSDAQMLRLAEDPDAPVENLTPGLQESMSLREFCRHGADRGATTLRVAYDYFFGGSGRSLYPDENIFQDALKKIHDVAQEFGLGLEPSILSPLELGVGYQKQTGESGRWLHYREGLRDPETGNYSVVMWQHQRWCNNKGPTPITLIGARAFAFSEKRIPHTSFFVVNPDEIIELAAPQIEEIGPTFTPHAEATAPERAPFKALQVRVHGSGDTGVGALDRVLVVLQYATVEMDYFSPAASEFLSKLVRQYTTKEISITGLYSDEMHIQQDWSYHSHLENGQFTLRYVSEGFERAFAQQYGAQYADFAKYMLYFASHQHDFLTTHEPKLGSQHVFGPSQEDIHATLKMRRDYYHFLESGVLNLMIDAKTQWQELLGCDLDAYYHATWAESPTVDVWRLGDTVEAWSSLEHRRKYEYGPDFLWSNTVHQAASACADYFGWNEFLTGGNNDTAEGGYSDRNYFARALACSLAELNRRPLAHAAHWGMPFEVHERMEGVNAVFGSGGHAIFRSVGDYASRQTEVIFLYPQDLVAVDERFGSWMVQYGYANYITAEKLLEYGHVTHNGKLRVKNAQYSVICALYEPFPSPALRDLLLTFVHNGGTIIWSSVPPLDQEGQTWLSTTFGITLSRQDDPLGTPFPARQITFEGVLDAVAPMTILTDLVVDRVFAVDPLDGTQVVARLRPGGAVATYVVGTRKQFPGGGQALYLGFRPRDDQAASLGYDVRTWFEILHALDAYPASGVFEQNDNPAVLARTTDYVAGRFSNGTIAVAPHYKDHEESWPGGFFRDEASDRAALQANPVPDDTIMLENCLIAGQRVSFSGKHAVAWRLQAAQLVGFAGVQCSAIELNGKTFRWSDHPVTIAWHPLSADYSLPGITARYRVWCDTTGIVRFPLNLDTAAGLEVWLGAHVPFDPRTRKDSYGRAGYGTQQIAFSVAEGNVILDVDETMRGHWLYVIQRG
jgi:hypothetical protein